MVRRKIGEEEEHIEHRIALPIRGLLEAEDSESDFEDPIVNSMVAAFRKNLTTKTSIDGDFISIGGKVKGSLDLGTLESGVTEDDCYLKEGDGGITVQKFLSSKTSLEDTSGAALASYSPKLGKKKMKKLKKAEREKNKGKDWFNMPALELTEERKADLELLQMRGVLDPKRFYKRSDKEGLPKYFQIGTVVDNAADFYTDRVPNKARKSTMVDELLADAEFKKFQKRKYVEIIKDKERNSGRRKFTKKNKNSDGAGDAGAGSKKKKQKT